MKKAPGQFLNKDKSIVFFSSNTRDEDKERILEVGAVMGGSYEKYLGLLFVVGKSKYNTFRCIKERVWQEVNS